MADRVKLRHGPKSKIDAKNNEIVYVDDEERLYKGGTTDPIPLPNMKDITDLKESVANASGLFINETLPEVSDRKPNVLYFKVTETLTTVGSNIKVNPNMGIKIIE